MPVLLVKGFAMIQFCFSRLLLVATEILIFANDCFFAGDGLELHRGKGGGMHASFFCQVPSHEAMHPRGADSQHQPTSCQRTGCVSILVGLQR